MHHNGAVFPVDRQRYDERRLLAQNTTHANSLLFIEELILSTNLMSLQAENIVRRVIVGVGGSRAHIAIPPSRGAYPVWG